MRFGYIGINYKNAPLDIRDKTSFTDVDKIDFFQNAEKIGIGQCMILSTCNRSEVYFLYRKAEEKEAVKKLYLDTFQEVQLNDLLLTLDGNEAIEYLFRIAAGLESLVLGEDQILGQVKDALEFSKAMGYSGKEMNKIVRDAVTCAKKIKTDLKISERPLSVSYVGIQQLEKVCKIEGKTVLVIGSGKTSTLALHYLYEYGAGNVMICSRTTTHAKELLQEFPQLTVVEFEQRYQIMETCDIVVSATSAPHVIVRADKLHTDHPITFLDLAAPRDIDTALQGRENVTILNLDFLSKIVENNQKERERLVEISKGMIQEATEETKEWLLSSRMDSTIESLQLRCDEIVQDSYEYLNRKIEFSAREQKIIKKVLNASLHRLLREPIQELKQLDTREKQDKYQEIVKELFQI